MRQRDWVLAGAMFGFTAAGLYAWQAAGPGDAVRTVIGAVPIALGIVALTEFARRTT